MKTKNLSGLVFGLLTVIEEVHTSENKAIRPSHRKWVCRCACGKYSSVSSASLGHGKTKSCGCLRLKGREPRHGDTNSHEYEVWSQMKRRCLNPKNPAYKNYGGRGITVCERWLNSYENFIADMGRRPSDLHSIDRINNDGNYEPSNCKWSTRLEQCANKRGLVILEITGLRMSKNRWAESFGIKPATLDRRLKLGWTPYDAVTTPVGAKRKVESRPTT